MEIERKLSFSCFTVRAAQLPEQPVCSAQSSCPHDHSVPQAGHSSSQLPSSLGNIAYEDAISS